LYGHSAQTKTGNPKRRNYHRLSAQVDHFGRIPYPVFLPAIEFSKADLTWNGIGPGGMLFAPNDLIPNLIEE
jgi:hypothetical protein